MAIARDNSSGEQWFGYNVAGGSFAFTTSGANRILFVAITYSANLGAVNDPTYNGVAMTLIGTGLQDYNPVNANPTSLWYMINPPTGSNTLAVSTSVVNNFVVYAVSYTGVKQSAQPDASAASAHYTTTTSFSMSVTTVADNCWAIMAGSNRTGTAITAGSNTNILSQPEVHLCGSFIADTNSVKTPAGTDTMTVTSASAEYAGVMASFAPVATTGPDLLSLLGCG